MQLPEKVMHCDWGTAASKRWGAEAQLANGHYVVSGPRLVTNPVAEAIELGVPIMLGFDFPIGLPQTYCELAGITSFLELLPELGSGEWRNFFTPAVSREEISLRQPFYPARPGGTKQAHLIDGLGVASIDDLRRVCDRRHGTRRAAQVIFWTLGANQVGRAAIAGWREMLIPALGDIAIWPFAGGIERLLVDAACVVCETYPAEFYGHLGLPANKTPDARQAAAPAVLSAMGKLDVEFDEDLKHEIERGLVNDDAYDAFVGLLGIINILLGNRTEAPQLDHKILAVEGWMLGQDAPGSGEPDRKWEIAPG